MNRSDRRRMIAVGRRTGLSPNIDAATQRLERAKLAGMHRATPADVEAVAEAMAAAENAPISYFVGIRYDRIVMEFDRPIRRFGNSSAKMRRVAMHMLNCCDELDRRAAAPAEQTIETIETIETEAQVVEPNESDPTANCVNTDAPPADAPTDISLEKK